MRRYLLNWDVSGLRSLEYLVSLMGHLGDKAINFGDIGQESTCIHALAVGINSRQSVLASKFNDDPGRGPELVCITHHEGIHAILHDGGKSSAKLWLLERTINRYTDQ